MNLEIRSFADAGELSKERIVLRATTDVDVGDYAVFRSGVSSDGNPTSGRKSAYWFPNGAVKAGDSIVLYSKKGQKSTKRLEDGRTAHFFYWGKQEALWGSPEFCAVVLEVLDWEYKVPVEAQPRLFYGER